MTDPVGPTVLTIGTFDVLHVGHLNLFAACRKIAGPNGRVVVGVNSDEFVEKYKGAYPLMNLRERSRLVRALRDVDWVIGNYPDRQIETLRDAFTIGLPYPPPRFLVVGSDWAAKNYFAQIEVDPTYLFKHSISLLYHPYTLGVSSSKLKRHEIDVD